MAITDDLGLLEAAERSRAIHRRELLPTEREVSLGAPDTGYAFEPVLRRDGSALALLFKNFVRDLNPRTIVGSKMTLAVLFGLALFNAWDDIVVGIVYPEMRADFSFDLLFLTALLQVIGIVTDLVAPFVGWLVDRVKRVWILRIGVLMLHSSALVTGTAGSFGGLIGAKGLALGGRAFIEPSTPPLIADAYQPRSRLRVFSFQAVGISAGVAIAPLLAGIFSDRFGWRSVVLTFGAISLTVAMTTFLVREPPRSRPRAVPPMPFAEAFRTGWGIKTLRKIWVATLMGPATIVGQIYMGFYLADAGYDATQRGEIFFAVGMAALVFIPLTGGIASRLVQSNPARLMSLLGGVYLVSTVSLVVISLSHNILLSAVCMVPFWAAVGFVIPATQGVTSLILPPTMLGIGLATINVFRPFGRLAFLALLGLAPLLQGFVDFQSQTILLTMAIPTGIAAVMMGSGATTIAGDMRSARAHMSAKAETERAREAGGNKLLVCRDVDVRYDGVQVLFGVDLDVEEGELVALLGTNGAGKSTLMRAFCGLQPASAGAIFLDGMDVTHEPAHLITRRGVVMVPGGHAVFPSLTVEENLRIAAWIHAADPAYVAESLEEVLGVFPVLRDKLRQQAGNMSGGEQQMLAVGQALIMKPRLLLIDELSLGLAPKVVDTLLQTVRRINEAGTTVILIEQSLNVAMTIAKRAVYMEKGVVRFDGPTEQLWGRPELVRAVFMGGAATGGSGGRARPRLEGEAREKVLQVQDVSVSFGGVRALDGATLEVGPEEIVGIIGPNGAGKTTVFDVISGFLKPEDGAVLMSGNDVTRLAPEGRAHLGLGRSFQNARLFPSLTVRENIAVAMEQAIKVKNPLLNALWLPAARRGERLVHRRVDGLIDLLRLGAYADKFVNELSTGTRRSVDIACIMASSPKLLLLDEPSSGLAQAETEALGPVIERVARDAGCSVLVIEHDIGLVSSISHRLYAMELGAVVTSGPPDQVVSDPRVLSSYLAATDEVLARSDLGRLTHTSTATPEETRLVHDHS